MLTLVDETHMNDKKRKQINEWTQLYKGLESAWLLLIRTFYLDWFTVSALYENTTTTDSTAVWYHCVWGLTKVRGNLVQQSSLHAAARLPSLYVCRLLYCLAFIYQSLLCWLPPACVYVCREQYRWLSLWLTIHNYTTKRFWNNFTLFPEIMFMRIWNVQSRIIWMKWNSKSKEMGPSYIFTGIIEQNHLKMFTC